MDLRGSAGLRPAGGGAAGPERDTEAPPRALMPNKTRNVHARPFDVIVLSTLSPPKSQRSGNEQL